MQFQEEMGTLLERHILNGLVDVPWVRTDDPESDNDDEFSTALQELVGYAFEETVGLIKKKKSHFFQGWREIRAKSSRKIHKQRSLCFRSIAVS